MDRAPWNYGCMDLWALEQEAGRNGLVINPLDCYDYLESFLLQLTNMKQILHLRPSRNYHS